MSAAIDLLRDAFGRVHENVHAVLDDSTTEQLAFRADARSNSPAWLVWHLTRVQDDHLAPSPATSRSGPPGASTSAPAFRSAPR